MHGLGDSNPGIEPLGPNMRHVICIQQNIAHSNIAYKTPKALNAAVGNWGGGGGGGAVGRFFKSPKP